MDLAAVFISTMWDCLEPVVAMRRIGAGIAALENFEYLAVRSKSWLREHPTGNYPPGSARLMTQERAQAIVDKLGL